MSAKKKPQQTELINIRFYENQKRQALTTTLAEVAATVVRGEGCDNELSSVTTAEVTGAEQICDTAEKVNPSLGVSSSFTLAQKHEADLIHTSSSDTNTDLPFSSSSTSLAVVAQSDKSRKGSVDQRIWNLVNLINTQKDEFFTTSSCSGRIILYTWDKGEAEAPSQVPAAERKKEGCKWLLVSHDEVDPAELVNSFLSASSQKDISTEVNFKMEPCILHVQCRLLSNARKLIHIATESGFRNSGMVIGKENRITVAIRSAIGLEVPFPTATEKSANLISAEYLKYLADVANSKMRENWVRSVKMTELFAATSWKMEYL